eukprot:COSAG06_NODE_18111_length_901_cov_1.930348_2_plen_29_part_01
MVVGANVSLPLAVISELISILTTVGGAEN